MSILKAIVADITSLELDVIVNAANSSLLGGGGVDGAIHRTAGPDLLHECRILGGCKTGEAKLTHGHKLPAKYIIHTVGPVWQGGQKNESKHLANCYQNSFELAKSLSLRTIAFPSISTGIFGFPIAEASRIAVEKASEFLALHENCFDEIIFCCFSRADFEVYQQILSSCNYEKISPTPR